MAKLESMWASDEEEEDKASTNKITTRAKSPTKPKDRSSIPSIKPSTPVSANQSSEKNTAVEYLNFHKDKKVLDERSQITKVSLQKSIWADDVEDITSPKIGHSESMKGKNEHKKPGQVVNQKSIRPNNDKIESQASRSDILPGDVVAKKEYSPSSKLESGSRVPSGVLPSLDSKRTKASDGQAKVIDPSIKLGSHTISNIHRDQREDIKPTPNKSPVKEIKEVKRSGFQSKTTGLEDSRWSDGDANESNNQQGYTRVNRANDKNSRTPRSQYEDPRRTSHQDQYVDSRGSPSSARNQHNLNRQTIVHEVSKFADERERNRLKKLGAPQLDWNQNQERRRETNIKPPPPSSPSVKQNASPIKSTKEIEKQPRAATAEEIRKAEEDIARVISGGINWADELDDF